MKYILSTHLPNYILESEELHANLADLSCDISIKERLIEELELSQKRLHTMKVQYEEKLLNLSERIRQTEVERDKVLSNIGKLLDSCGLLNSTIQTTK